MPELSSRRKIIKAYRAACATRSPSVRRKMEIIKELRHGLTYFAGEAVDCSDLMEEAADRIEAQEAEIEESRNEQKLSESWRIALMNRTLELEAEADKMIDALHRCRLHLVKEAEADFVEDRWQANDAMILCIEIDELFAAHPLPAALHPDAYKSENDDG